MAVSGSIDFTMTRDDAIQEALEQLGVLGEGDTPTAAQLTSDSRTLNLMLKAWQNKEVSQNLIRRAYIWFSKGQRDYPISTTAASSAPSAYDFYADTVATAYTALDPTLLVTTGTGAADGDTIVLVDDTGVIATDTVASGGGTTTLTLTTGFSISASAGASYYAYTTQITRPIAILFAERKLRPTDIGEHDVINSISVPMKVGVRRDYHELSSKATEGAPSMIWYDEQWEDGLIHVWPQPGTIGEFLEIWMQVTIDDMDGPSDNFALPSRWYLAVAFNLALWLTPKYGVSDKTFGRVAGLAKVALDEAEMFESEDELQFMPDNRRR